MVEVWKLLAQSRGIGSPFVHTLYHVLYSLCVIFAEVDDSSLCFSESIAAGTIEEG